MTEPHRDLDNDISRPPSIPRSMSRITSQNLSMSEYPYYDTEATSMSLRRSRSRKASKHSLSVSDVVPNKARHPSVGSTTTLTRRTLQDVDNPENKFLLEVERDERGGSTSTLSRVNVVMMSTNNEEPNEIVNKSIACDELVVFPDPLASNRSETGNLTSNEPNKCDESLERNSQRIGMIEPRQ